MNRLESVLRFLYAFIIGDDWRIAAGVVLAIAATALLADANVAAWWVLPLVVASLLARSAWRAARASR